MPSVVFMEMYIERADKVQFIGSGTGTDSVFPSPQRRALRHTVVDRVPALPSACHC